MKSAGSVVGVLAGLILGLAVVAVSGHGLVQYIPQNYSIGSGPSQTTQNPSQQTATATTSGSSGVSPGSGTAYSTYTPGGTSAGKGSQNAPTTSARGIELAQVDNLARQPASLTVFVMLPVLAAVMFGIIVYRSSERQEIGDAPATPD